MIEEGKYGRSRDNGTRGRHCHARVETGGVGMAGLRPGPLTNIPDIVPRAKPVTVGRILTGPAMDSHNSLDAPNVVHPVSFNGNNDGGGLSFDLPPRSVTAVSLE